MNGLSAAMRSRLVQLVIVVVTQKTIERREIIGGGATSPVFAFNDGFQRTKISQKWGVVINPDFIAMSF